MTRLQFLREVRIFCGNAADRRVIAATPEPLGDDSTSLGRNGRFDAARLGRNLTHLDCSTAGPLHQRRELGIETTLLCDRYASL